MQKLFRKILPDLIVLAGYLILPMLLYWSVTVGPNTMLPVDNLYQWEPWRSHAADFGVELPDNALISDLIIQNYVWKSTIKETVLSGDIPLWNPNLFAGAPFLATGQNAAYYPFSLIFFVMPLTKAYGWFTVSQLTLAGFMLFLLGRTYGLSRQSAYVGGLIYQGCGFMLVSAAVFPMIISAAVWLPLLIACLEQIIRNTTRSDGAGKTLPWAALGALTLGVQILAGHIEITYYSLMVMAFYAAWRLVAMAGRSVDRSNLNRLTDLLTYRSTLLRPSAWLLVTVLIGLLVGGIQFIPFYEVGASNFREGSASLEQIRDWAFPERRILTLVLPDFFGNPTDHSYVDAFTGEDIPFTTNAYGNVNPWGPYSSNWGIKNYVEGGIYFGVISLVLAVLGVISPFLGLLRRRVSSQQSTVGSDSVAANPVTNSDNRTRPLLAFILHPSSFFLILALLSLAFIFGTPLYAVLYYGFPGINQLHSPFRWIFPLSLCVAVLAAYGLEVARSGEQGANVAEKGARGGEQGANVADGGYSQNQGSNHNEPPINHSTIQQFNHSATKNWLRWTAWAVLLAGAVTLLGLYLSRPFFDLLEPRLSPIFMGLAQAPDAFPDFKTFYSYLFPQLRHLGLMLLGSGMILWLLAGPKTEYRTLNTGHWLLLTTYGLLIFDLFTVGRGFNASVDPALLDFKPEMVQWLEAQPGRDQWRITSFDNKGSKPFNANAGWLTGFRDIRGYDSIIAKQYTEYMGRIEPQEIGLLANRIEPLSNWESINSPLVDLLGVKYIITQETLDLPKLSLAWRGENLNVYENLAVMPRSYTIPAAATVMVEDAEAALDGMMSSDPRLHVLVERDMLAAADDHTGRDLVAESLGTASDRGQARITDETNRRLLIDTTIEGREPAWLILNDSYFPGWRAYYRPFGGSEAEDEQEIAIARVNGNFRGVLLPPGNWTVRFQYSPPSFWVGGLASAMGLIVIGFSFVVWGWRRYYRQDGELSNTASIAKNSIAPMTLNLFNRGIDFLFAIFYLRWLGPVDTGAYTTAITIAGIYEILANFGLNAYLIREVSQDKSKTTGYLLNTTVLRLGTGLIAALPILLYIWGAESNAATRTAVVYLMVGMVLSGMASGLAGLFYAYEEAEIPATVTTITTILKVGFGVVVLLIGFGFVGLAAVSIAVNAITLLILIYVVRGRYRFEGPWSIDLSLQRRMLIDSYPLMINHFLATIYWQVDILILRQLQGEATVGWYNAAYKYINAFNVIPSFFTFALFPVISRQVQSSVEDARRTFRMAIKLLSLVSLPLAAFVTFLAPLMIGILGGDDFLPEGQIALQVVIWSIPFGWLNSVTNYVLISLGQERIQTRAFLIGVGFNFIGNLIVIPYLSFVGAGLTTIASEIVLLALFNYYLVQKMPSVDWFGLLWRLVLITGVLVLAMWALSAINLWLAVGAGILLYPAGLWLLGVFGEAERAILVDILPESLTRRLSRFI